MHLAYGILLGVGFAALAWAFAARQRRAAHRQLQAVLDATSSALIAVDGLGRVTHWNAAAERMTDLPAPEAVGRPAAEVLPWLEQHRERLDQVLRDGQPAALPREAWQGEHHVDARIHPLPDRAGAVIRLDDATDLEMQDEQLRQEQRMDAVRVLAGGLAHDFNNIMAAIMATVSLLKLQVDEGNPPLGELTEGLDLVNHSASRAVELVRNLTVLAHRQELTFGTVDLARVAENVVRQIRGAVDGTVAVELVRGVGPVWARADATRLEEAVINLCLNAWHAMTLMRPAGAPQGGTIRVEVALREVDEAFRREHPRLAVNQFCLIAVSDTGVGIDRETRKRIFDPFFTTKPVGRGTGLGLSTAYSVVQLHGGLLDVHSEPGVGSEFRVCLPVAEGVGQAATPAARELRPGSGRVLVVDDEPAVLEMAVRGLRTYGYQVEKANAGEQALELFRQDPQRFDLVVLDMAMPGLSGLEVFHAMRQAQPGVRVLFQSGASSDVRITQGVAAGAKGCLQKPYTTAELSLRVAEALA